MVSGENTVIAFDLYGTLLSTESIAKELATHCGEEKAAIVAATWRRYQLEYTWRSNSMSAYFYIVVIGHKLPRNPNLMPFKDQYIPFSTLTSRSLQHALSENNISLPTKASQTTLLSAYDSLSTFPDVPPELDLVRHNPSITPVVFSNGTQKMVTNSVYHSPDLSPYSNVFKDVITVEEVEKFKPHPDVYFHLAEKVGKKREQMGEMWLVSANPFDIVGAKAVGMRTCWVDRGGGGWVDGLIEGEKGRPDLVMRGLGEVVKGDGDDADVRKPWER
ncbi:MAG: hypothetical protein L6R41_001686 [Letrouitia leprolyta]|nr:MAG: hypothetical protein L6R41_001686 [Letrouitia leprolyta]